MYTRSLMEQNCYHVFKQSIHSDNVPADGSSRPLPDQSDSHCPRTK
jgi:hypothetical protein